MGPLLAVGQYTGDTHSPDSAMPSQKERRTGGRKTPDVLDDELTAPSPLSAHAEPGRWTMLDSLKPESAGTPAALGGQAKAQVWSVPAEVPRPSKAPRTSTPAPVAAAPASELARGLAAFGNLSVKTATPTNQLPAPATGRSELDQPDSAYGSLDAVRGLSGTPSPTRGLPEQPVTPEAVPGTAPPRRSFWSFFRRGKSE